MNKKICLIVILMLCVSCAERDVDDEEVVPPAVSRIVEVQGQLQILLDVNTQNRISLIAQDLAGQSLPASAIVWNEGKAWCYGRMDDEHFVRMSLPSEFFNSGKVFVSSGKDFQTTDIVTTGAQVLLSEEFRDQIQAEE